MGGFGWGVFGATRTMVSERALTATLTPPAN